MIGTHETTGNHISRPSVNTDKMALLLFKTASKTGLFSVKNCDTVVREHRAQWPQIDPIMAVLPAEGVCIFDLFIKTEHCYTC